MSITKLFRLTLAAAGVIAVLVAVPARANLVVGEISPPGSPIALDAGGASVPLLVSVAADTELPLPDMGGGLEVESIALYFDFVPVGVTSGSLSISSIAGVGGSGFALFSSDSNGAYVFSLPVGPPDPIITVAGLDVLAISVEAAPGTSGTFELTLVSTSPDSGASSIWSAAAPSPSNDYTNLLSPGLATPVLATFIASVPEPSAFLFGTAVLGLIGGTSLRKRNRTEVVEA